jgi:hypothetical protein
MLEELGRRFLDTQSWRWMPGMLTLGGDRVKSVTDDGDVYLDRAFVTLSDLGDFSVGHAALSEDDVPNVEDAGTVGIMVDVLRMATGYVAVLMPSNEVRFYDENGEIAVITGASRTDALLLSFEAADVGLGS